MCQSDSLSLSPAHTSSSSSGCELRSFERSKTSVLPDKLFVIQSFALGRFYVEDKDAGSGGVLEGGWGSFHKVIMRGLAASICL